MNPYEVLQVDRDADEATIKSAYRKLARKWHPDLAHNDEERRASEIKMKQINEAYEILESPEKRKEFNEAHPDKVNVYEYYASQFQKKHRRKTKDSKEIKNEKQRQAIVQFLNVEFARKKEIFEMFMELADNAFHKELSEEEYLEYLEYLELLLEEQKECIANIQKILDIVQKKKVSGLDNIISQARDVIEELRQKGNSVPRSLEDAFYEEETRRITHQINNLIKGFPGRLSSILNFDILHKTWEFSNDKQLKACCQKAKTQVEKLLKDIEWVQVISAERKISIPTCSDGMTIEECKIKVEKRNKIFDGNLQLLREKFWKEVCNYITDKKGNVILNGFEYTSYAYKGNFICPPHIDGICDLTFRYAYFTSITIPAKCIPKYGMQLEYGDKLKYIIFTFDECYQTVDISKINADKIVRKGKYICVCKNFSWRGISFALIDEKGVYMYDEKRICQLNQVSTMAELTKKNQMWERGWNNYQLQIHAWAQVVQKLPVPNIMAELPFSIGFIQNFVKLDTRQLDEALSKCDDSSKTRLVQLYIGLGALNGSYCHAQAEWLISQIDISEVYRSRLERYPGENKSQKSPMFSVPKEAVDFVQKNISNREFIKFVFSFLEGYKFFLTEAKKAKVNITPEFVIKTATQYIFHGRADASDTFVNELLKSEKEIENIRADRILHIYMIQQKLNCKANKVIKETIDKKSNSEMHYRFFDIESLDTYRRFAEQFQMSKKESRNTGGFYKVETENIFIDNNTHAIEIVDSENKRKAIAILNLFNEGELFADVFSWKNTDWDNLSLDRVIDIQIAETIERALLDQKAINSLVTGISIGSNEDPRGSESKLRDIIYSTEVASNMKEQKWIKFEYLFKNKPLGISYKGYRVRCGLEGHIQNLSIPHPYKNPKYQRKSRW